MHVSQDPGRTLAFATTGEDSGFPARKKAFVEKMIQRRFNILVAAIPEFAKFAALTPPCKPQSTLYGRHGRYVRRKASRKRIRKITADYLDRTSQFGLARMELKLREHAARVRAARSPVRRVVAKLAKKPAPAPATVAVRAKAFVAKLIPDWDPLATFRKTHFLQPRTT